MAPSRYFSIPKPKSFLHFVSLRSAAELIIFILLINKVSGLYGILALFTGYELNPLQLSHYVYNLLTLALVAWLSTAIRAPQAPLKALGLAWVYCLDTVVNTAYTGFFVASWFAVLAQHLGQEPQVPVPGAGTMEDTSGFTSPEVDASRVDIVAGPSGNIMVGQKAAAYPSTDGLHGSPLLQSGSLPSLAIIATFLLIRIYFCLIIMSHARNIVRQYVLMSSTSYAQTDDPNLAENPFRKGREEGEGLKGRLGRFLLLSPSRSYWLGRDNSVADWARNVSGKPAERKSIGSAGGARESRVAAKKIEQ